MSDLRHRMFLEKELRGIMINFELGEQTSAGQNVELPIEVKLNAPSGQAASLPTNISFTFTLTNPVTQVKVTYSYTDPNLLRVVEGGQTFQIEGEYEYPMENRKSPRSLLKTVPVDKRKIMSVIWCGDVIDMGLIIFRKTYLIRRSCSKLGILMEDVNSVFVRHLNLRL